MNCWGYWGTWGRRCRDSQDKIWKMKIRI
jgi:hypothetical protein